jgi:hypothetical protein
MTPIPPETSREQVNHVFIAGGRSSRNPRRFQRPILSRTSRQQPHRRSVQPMAAVNFSRVGARRVTHPAHRHSFHNVLSAFDPALVASGLHSRACLAGCSWPPADTECCQPQDDRNPRERSKVPRPKTPEVHSLPWDLMWSFGLGLMQIPSTELPFVYLRVLCG